MSSTVPSAAPCAMPPLNALKAFEAAARHGSLAAAALELNVTTGALSHQVRALEGFLGTPLLQRLPRGVALSASGRLLYPGLASGFAQLRGAVQGLRDARQSHVLVVTTPPGVTAKWLAPRLHRFAESYPGVELRIASSSAYANFATDGVDLAIRSLVHGAPCDPALMHETLLPHTLVAVCAPALLPPGFAPADLSGLPLIHDDQLAGRPEVPTWTDWFAAAGLPLPAALAATGAAGMAGRGGLRFSSAEHAIEVAARGAGMLLAHTIMAHDELRAGRLVMPLPLVLRARRSFYLVAPRTTRLRPAVAAFRDWLHAEVAQMDKALLDG